MWAGAGVLCGFGQVNNRCKPWPRVHDARSHKCEVTAGLATHRHTWWNKQLVEAAAVASACVPHCTALCCTCGYVQTPSSAAYKNGHRPVTKLIQQGASWCVGVQGEAGRMGGGNGVEVAVRRMAGC